MTVEVLPRSVRRALVAVCFLFPAAGLAVPSPPSILAPGTGSAPGLALSTTTPTFFWNASAGATRYGLFISKAPYGSANIIYSNNFLTGTSFTIPSGNLVNGTQYRWNMTAFDGSGESGVSNTLYFNVSIASPPPSPPNILSPGSGSAPGVSIGTTTPTFSWSSVSGATRYGIFISKSPYGSSNIIYSNEFLSGTSFTIPNGNLVNGTQYRWNMTAFNNSGESGVSNTLYFTVSIASPPPSPPNIVSPGSGSAPGVAIGTTTPTFSWNGVSGATRYGLFLSQAPYGSANIIYSNEFLSGTSFTLPGGVLVNGGQYRWNMTAFNSSGESGVSNTLYFTVSTASPPPSPPAIVSPGSGSAPGVAISTTTPTFSWNGVNGATRYGLFLSQAPYGSANIIYSNEFLSGTSFPLPGGVLANGGQYRWNMTAFNNSGESGVSNTLYFTVSVASACTVSCTASAPPQAEKGSSVSFAASAGVSGCTETPGFSWSFGDGGSSTQQSPGHVYSTAGTFTWSMTAAVASGPSCSRSGSITITEDAPSDCFPLTLTVQPAGSGTVGVGTPDNCPGGYEPGTQVHIFAQPASGFTFERWTASGGALSDAFSSSIFFTLSGPAAATAHFRQATSGEAPKAAFTYSPAGPRVGQQVSFRDQSTGGPTAWAWDFDGNGSVDSTAQSPSNTFPAPGPYPVTLRASNAFGESRTTQTVTVTAAAGQPRVTRVTRQFEGVFLAGGRFNNRFDVAVDWQGTPGTVSFSINGGAPAVEAGNANGANHTFRMESDFAPSSTPATIRMIATNGAGVSGPAWEESVYVVPLPRWLAAAVQGGWGELSSRPGNGEVVTEIASEFPQPHLEALIHIPEAIPVIGGDFGLRETFGRFDGSVSSRGSGRFSFHGETGLELGKRSFGGELSGTGEYALLPPDGLQMSGAFHLGIDASRTWEINLVQVITGLEEAGRLPGLGRVLSALGRAGRLETELQAKVDAHGTFASESHSGDLVFRGGTLGADIALKGFLRTEVPPVLIVSGWLGGEGGMTLGVPAPHVRGAHFRFEVGAEITLDALLRVDVGPFLLCGGARVAVSALAAYSCDWTGGAEMQCDGTGDVDLSEEGCDKRAADTVSITPIAPDYERFGEPSRWIGDAGASAKASPAEKALPGTLLENVFPGASPQLVSTRDGQLLLWVQQDPTLPVLQSTDIAWSWKQGEAWTSSRTIGSDTQVELEPVAGVDAKGKVVAAWLRIKEPLFTAEVATYDALALFYRKLEVVSAVFDPERQSWSPPTVLTDDAAMERDLRMSSDGSGRLMLTWLSNPDGELVSTSASPSSLRFAFWNGARWSAPATVAGGLAGVATHAPALRRNDAFLVVPRDPDPTRTDDGVLDLYTWRGSSWSPASRFASGGDDRLPAAGYDAAGEGHVLWLRGADLVQASLRNPHPTVVRPASNGLPFLDFEFLTNARGNLTLVWQQLASSGLSQVFARIYDPKARAWSLDRQITEQNAALYSSSAAYDRDDVLHIAFLATQIGHTLRTVALPHSSVTIPNVPEVGRTDLQVLDRSLRVDLAALSFQIAPAAPQPGDRVSASMELQNSGDFTVGSFTVRIYAGDPARGAEQLASQRVSSLRAGERRKLSLSFTHPQGARRLVAVVDADDVVDELTEANNRASLGLGNARPEARVKASVVSGSAPLTVRLDGSESTDADGDPLSFAWAFADGTPSGAGRVAFHTFAKPGTYPVTLVVTDGEGEVATAVVDIVVQPGKPSCSAGAANLCLSRNRFHVSAVWSDPAAGSSGAASAVKLTGDTGYFWFFNRDNVELVVKVLDGRGTNGHFWVFYGALSSVEYTLTVLDTQTGAVKTYHNPASRLASAADTQAFEVAKQAAGPPLDVVAQDVIAPLFVEAAAKAACGASSSALCLSNRRFKVEVSFKDAQGRTATARAVPLTADTGYFWFFESSNVELVVKVLDGRPINGHFWVFSGALSSVEYTVTVTDSETGERKTFRNPAGRLASLADTEAF